MRKLISILLFTISITLTAVFSAAQEPAAGAASLDTATGTASQSAATPLPPPQDAAAQAPKSQPVDPAGLMAKVLSVYTGQRSFTIEFTLAQPPSRGKVNEDHLSKLTERYLLMYLDENPEDQGYLLRLESLEGYNRRTTVVYAPDDKGEYVYRVYKPALPNGSVLKEDNILVRDVAKALPAFFLQQLDGLLKDPKNEVTAEFYPGGNKYILQVDTQMPFQNKDKPHRIITTFSGPDYKLVSREIHYKAKDDFKFLSRMEWINFNPGAGITKEDITKPPDFKKN